MAWQYNSFIVPSLLAAVVAALLGRHIWTRRPAAGATPLALLMGLVSFCSLVIVLGIGAQNQETAVLAWKLQYFFVEGVPLLWLLFALQYAQQDEWLTPQRWVLLLLLPIISLGLAWTNEWHEWMWQGLTLELETAVITWQPAPWYWVDIIYNYLLVGAGSLILLWRLRHFRDLYRLQLAAILFGLGVPWFVNVLYQLVRIPFYIPLAPIGFLFSGFAFAWGIYRYRLFDVLPVAHESLVYQMQDALLVVNERNRLLHLNPAAQALLPADTASLIGTPLHQSQDPLLASLHKLGQAGVSHSSIIVDDPKPTRYFTVQITPLYRRQHRLGQLFVLHDVTDLQVAREKAEAAAQAKAEFVSNVSHELRTPLTSISLYLDLLDRGQEDKRVHYLQTLRHETNRLRHLIEDLLHISRLDLGKVEPARVAVNLAAMAQTLYEDRQPLFARRGLHLSLQLQPVPAVLGDPQLLEQVVSNLMSNALNYTPAGGEVVLETAVVNTTSAPGVALRVIDTGYGIPADEIPCIFDRFVRGHASRQTGAAGTGLGLAISREIAQMHRGEIRVTSEVGVGSTFTIWLPAAPTPQATAYTPQTKRPTRQQKR